MEWLRRTSPVASPPASSSVNTAGKHGGLVHGQVDHTVGDDHVDRVRRQWDGLDGALEELNVGRAGVGRVVAGKCEHFVDHVQTNVAPGQADPARRQQHVDATAGAEVEDP